MLSRFRMPLVSIVFTQTDKARRMPKPGVLPFAGKPLTMQYLGSEKVETDRSVGGVGSVGSGHGLTPDQIDLSRCQCRALFQIQTRHDQDWLRNRMPARSTCFNSRNC